MDTFLHLCVLILITYLILFLLAKAMFAIFGGEKKPSKKKSKPQKTKFSKVKEVKQDLISVEQLEKEESQIKKDSFVFLDSALPEDKKFDPNSLIEEKQPVQAEDKTAIDQYLNETKENEKREKLRQRREQFLKELNNPLKKYEKPEVDNKDDDFSSWLIKDEEKSTSDKSLEDLKRIQETQNRINLARENFRRMKEAETRSRAYAMENTMPKCNNKVSYEEVENLLDGMEAKQADNKLTLKDEFNNLSRDMKIFVLAKMINSDFKL